jgi:uncharacterized Zn-finger protein
MRTQRNHTPAPAPNETTVTAERSDQLLQPNARQHYEVTPDDLPLACPMPGMHLWNSHPRVFLPIETTGWAKCPYCSAEYTLRK